MKVILIVLTSILILACQNQNADKSKPLVTAELPTLSQKFEKFESCEELNSHIQNVNKISTYEYSRYNQWFQSEWGNSGGTEIVSVSAINESSSEQDQQVAGVNESDVVLKLEKLLIVSRKDSLEVLSYDINTTNINVIKTYEMLEIASPRLIMMGNQLFVYGYSNANPDLIQVRVYDLNNNENPLSLKQKFKISGFLRGARVIGDNFYLITQDYLKENVSLEKETCSNTFRPAINDLSLDLTKILHIKSSDQQLTAATQSYLGGTSYIYISENNLYLIQNSLNWFYWDDRIKQSIYNNFTLVRKINISKGNPHPVSMGLVHGRIHNQWALHEIDQEHFALAVTERNSTNFIDVNHFYILEEKKEIISIKSSIKDLAPSETIRSVRYHENLVYIVTFRQVDPLFIIDFNILEQPKLLSELKAPGFSTYLKPFLKEYLLGVGHSATEQGFVNGIQVSKFDVYDPIKPELIKQVTFSESDSTALYDHKAVYLDEAQESVGIPLVVRHYRNSMSHLNRTGFVLLDFKNDLSELNFFTHDDLMSESCKVKKSEGFIPGWVNLDVYRLYREHDVYISVSDFGVQMHNLKFELMSTVKFKNSINECIVFGI
ncbi:MAG: beta-propeller domain-containing protein [Bdellovibrionales bacterium]|nr:beta-propeller domain-containing protein [Bdellovibrionales bacterium]